MIEEQFTDETESGEPTVERGEGASAEGRLAETPSEAAAAETPELEPGAEADTHRDVKVVDKRRFARILGFGGAKGAEGEPEEDRRVPSYVAQLEDQLEQVKARAAKAEAASRAEVEAARQRLERHFEARLMTARADLLGSMLGVLDTLELALAAPGAEESPLYAGVLATRDLFVRQLAELGAEAVPSVGERFDPEMHEAVDEAEVEDEEADGTVVGELRRGFRMGGRLVRPATVRVGRYRAPRSGAEG